MADERASWEFEAGAEIAPGRTVLEALGGGRRFEVLLVWDDMRFAVMVAKVLRPDQAEDERALQEVREEAEALAALAHPVVVRGFDAVLDGPHPHLLLEHLEGPTLLRLLRKHGPLPLEQLLPLALHVAAALHYLANAGWVHLDVKPENIVMGVPPRLLDLSIARTLDRARRLRGSIGTDAYMPPEQCDADRFRGQIGPAADVWGLGATLHHAIAGQVPFPRPHGARDSPDAHVRFPQLVDEAPELEPPVPPALRDLVRSAMAFRPEDRPTAAEMATGLEPLVAALPRRLTFARFGTKMRST
ncbi:MAG TPA: serine/threonine-protein kinase [Baekduia sp.]|nr:serine/threonine-protein kinase [Baekduia sp.]